MKRETKRLKVIKNISFEIKEGEIVGFLGANGAGKTTILKMLCGLIYPSEGSILVQDIYLTEEKIISWKISP